MMSSPCCTVEMNITVMPRYPETNEEPIVGQASSINLYPSGEIERVVIDGQKYKDDMYVIIIDNFKIRR